MNPVHISTIATTLNLNHQNVEATTRLLNEGATVPFIARYRKEVTGSLDEVQVTTIRDLTNNLLEVETRCKAILESLQKRELLTPALQNKLSSAKSLTQLEDIYLPHRPKRRTRGMIAREKGLQPLAKEMFSGNQKSLNPKSFINPDKGIKTLDDVFSGAQDIIAEWINENTEIRIQLRKLFAREAIASSKVIRKNIDEGQKYRDYFDRQEKARSIAGHRLLAMLRGEKEKFLTLSFRPPADSALYILRKHYNQTSPYRHHIDLALTDSYKRLLAPSLENELRNTLKEQADIEAIHVFSSNIAELLLAPPLGAKRVMALDPGFRTGAKLVCLDAQGKLLHTTTIYPTYGGKKAEIAGAELVRLTDTFKIEAIAIGNGTASRETETFAKSLHLNDKIIITVVNEDGASIYSASESARCEFPDHDLTVRGAVSIGRRLQDPLAELVKLEPKSIGVGQYQHDVDQQKLKSSLEDVVIRCVNNVGVDVNSASKELLTYVSGLGPVLAQNILTHRNNNGPFKSRKDLLKVPRLGPKAFEQCAGFLRIPSSKNPLDNSSVHPERYKLVERMAKDQHCTVNTLLADGSLRKGINIQSYVSKDIGLPTLEDIISELAKPGRDPRQEFKQHSFAEGIHAIDDLLPEMELPGIVTNVTNFGAVVDIGVHQDGLVHISQLADRFVKDPNTVVKPRQQVTVRVLEIDKKRGRISLTMRKKS